MYCYREFNWHEIIICWGSVLVCGMWTELLGVNLETAFRLLGFQMSFLITLLYVPLWVNVTEATSFKLFFFISALWICSKGGYGTIHLVTVAVLFPFEYEWILTIFTAYLHPRFLPILQGKMVQQTLRTNQQQ